MRPLIAVSPNNFPAVDRHFYKHKELEYGDASIAAALRRAGALPIMLYRAALDDDAAMAAAIRAASRRLRSAATR